jgi:hypothetical protein
MAALGSLLGREGRTFDMRSLWRPAIWGGSATAALAIAVAAGYSDTGSRRMAAAGAPVATAQKMGATPVPAEVDAETHRLSEAVRILAADRERLVARIAALERNVEDMTGSVKRQPAPPSTGDSPAPSPAVAAPTSTANKEAAAPPAEGSPAPIAEPRATEIPAQERVAAMPDATDAAPASHEIGVDVGGAVNLEGAKALWTSTRAGNAVLFEGMQPLVVNREGSRTKSGELRLIAGPFADAEAAARVCAALAAAHRACQPVLYEGQRLADAEPAAERKPALKRTPRPANQPFSLFPRLFH